jgi:tetratricopeptide (TPR) repeat protein
MREEITRLEQMLLVGNFKRAVPIVESLRRKNDFKFLDRLRRESDARMRSTAAIAEVLFYCGHNDDARRLVLEAGDPAQWSRGDLDIAARNALQIVEYHYSLREFDSARMCAIEIRNRCASLGDHLGEAEASYYLARCHMRLYEAPEVYRACDRAIEHLSKAYLGEPAVQPFLWRTGLVMLVDGTTAAEAGDERCFGSLNLARAFLARSYDELGQANADNAIGAALRSRSGSQSDQDECISSFRSALRTYERLQHTLNIARAKSNLGRTYLAMRQWGVAGAFFDEALRAAEGIPDEKAKQRQRAETMVCKAWLHRESNPPDITRAIECAQSALAAVGAQQAGQWTIEARIVIGDCNLDSGNWSAARESLEKAWAVAEHRGVAKLRAGVLLALAELEAVSGDTRQAQRYWDEAHRRAAAKSSRYLRARAERVKTRIESRRDMWMVTRSDLSKVGLVRAKKDLEKWFVQAMDHESSMPVREKAKLAGMRVSGYYKLRRRAAKSVHARAGSHSAS